MHDIRIDRTWWAVPFGASLRAAGGSAARAAGLLLGVVVAVLPAEAAPQARPFNQPLQSTSTLARTRFGAATAVGQRVAVIGAPGDSQRGPDAGSVHVFDRSSATGAYAYAQQLSPAGIEPFDRFGDAVSLSGNLLAVAAKGDDDVAPNAGAVYVFERQGPETPFQLITKLVPPTAAASECFGYAVHVAPGQIAVGAPRADLAAFDAGAVYLYAYDSITQTATLEATITDPAARAGDGLGVSVAVGGDRLVAGADRLDASGVLANTGGVVDFVEQAPGQWVVGQVVLGSAPGPDAEFGRALAFEPPRPGVLGVLIVGAPTATRPGDTRPRGTVTVFEAAVGQPWTEVLTYGLFEPGIAGELGASIAVQNGVALVGAPGRDVSAGSVDILRRGALTWEREATVRLPGANHGDRAGSAVALRNSFPVIGAEGADVGGATDRGVAWSISDLWASVGDPYCSPGVPNSTGRAASLAARGSTSIAARDLTLEAGFLPTFSFSYALVSADPGFVAQPGTSQGNLCLGGEIGRLVDRPAQAQQDGRVQVVIDLTFIPLPLGPVVAQPGDTWYFQVWYRDANPQVTSNFTDAISVTFD